nr:hypothetical protein GTC16762_00720 [Pigmentibacter ruber]
MFSGKIKSKKVKGVIKKQIIGVATKFARQDEKILQFEKGDNKIPIMKDVKTVFVT